MLPFLYQKNKRINKRALSGGFTLIEMLVATAIFIVCMLIIVGALVSLNNASRKMRAIRIATDNLSAAIDSVSRNTRMGTTLHCGCELPANLANYAVAKDCPADNLGNGGAQCLAYRSQTGARVVYQLANKRIQRSTNGGAVGSFLDMTSPEMTITDLKFIVQGTTANEDQPLITMIVRGSTGSNAKTQTVFNLETTIDQRTPNYGP